MKEEENAKAKVERKVKKRLATKGLKGFLALNEEVVVEEKTLTPKHVEVLDYIQQLPPKAKAAYQLFLETEANPAPQRDAVRKIEEVFKKAVQEDKDRQNREKAALEAAIDADLIKRAEALDKPNYLQL